MKIPADKHAHVHHSSYEVNDLDSEWIGHNWLVHKGWTNCWGIGRHVLGSQIFDYWFDTSILTEFMSNTTEICNAGLMAPAILLNTIQMATWSTKILRSEGRLQQKTLSTSGAPTSRSHSLRGGLKMPERKCPSHQMRSTQLRLNYRRSRLRH